MRFSSTAAVAALSAVAVAAPNGQKHHGAQKHTTTAKPTGTSTSSINYATQTASDAADVYAAQATALTLSPTSKVKGKVFDRYVSIWFENTDFDMAAADPNFAFFAEQGITLQNLFALTHPSEPNYMATVGGDFFGLDGDPFTQVPQNVSTILDLLDDKSISYGIYQEDMPYSGYEGFDWVNQKTGANDYVRKHNPPVLYNSVATKPERLAVIKNTTVFYEDLKADKLPQWLFITPNMTSDGHDTSVTTAGVWLRSFLEPLLTNKNFMDNTLVLITFDENETYTIQNRVFSVVLGDVIPKHLHNTTDANFYDHYSELATVQANWDLHTLGRWDTGANVFSYVAQCTGDKVRSWTGSPALSDMFFNYSYPGIFNSETWAPQPVPNTNANYAGRTVLPAIKQQWAAEQSQTYYTTDIEIPDGYHIPVYPSSN